MTPTKSNNLAARMGRWSADHWKTATFGWLAFVIVAFGLGGLAGMKSIDPNKPGPGESGRMDRILDAGFKKPADESVLVQSRSLSATDPAFKAGVADVVARISKLKDVQNVRSPYGAGNADQISGDRHAARVEFAIRGDSDKAADKIAPVLAQVDNAQSAHPGAVHRRVRRRKRGQGGADRVRGRSREGRAPVASDHARNPRDRVRRARGRGHSAAARTDRDLRNLRADRNSEPHPARGAAGARAGAADRACRRRRLLDVLSPARAGGTSRGPQRAGSDRSGRRDVRPLGAHLRADRDDRDGRDVPDRRPDLRVVRRRDDPRRRHRHARLADRAAGPAVEARRRGRPGPGSARQPPAPRRRRGPDLGRDHRSRPAPATALGRCSPAGSCSCSPFRPSSSRWRRPARTRSRSRSPS